MDSLFYIAGQVIANEANISSFSDYSPFDGYIGIAADDLIAEIQYQNSTTLDDLQGLHGSYSYNPDPGEVSDLEIVHEANSSWDLENTNQLTIRWRDYYEYVLDHPDSDIGPETRVVGSRAYHSESVPIFDVLVDLYNRLVDTIAEFFDEIDWWN